MTSPIPSNPPPSMPPFSQGVQPKGGGHVFKDIGSKAKNVFGGLKGKWDENTQDEKRYLIVAAGIIAVVMVIFALLALIFGFGAVLTLLPAILPAVFIAALPAGMYLRSKYKRSQQGPPTQEQLEELKRQEVQMDETAKAHRVYNQRRRDARKQIS